MVDILAGFNDLFLKSPSQDFGKNQILAVHHRKVNFCFLLDCLRLHCGGSQPREGVMTICFQVDGAVKKFTFKKTQHCQKLSESRKP